MIFEKLAALLSEQFGVDVDSITMDTSFEDLGADSLDIVEMTMAGRGVWPGGHGRGGSVRYLHRGGSGPLPQVQAGGLKKPKRQEPRLPAGLRL